MNDVEMAVTEPTDGPETNTGDQVMNDENGIHCTFTLNEMIESRERSRMDVLQTSTTFQYSLVSCSIFKSHLSSISTA